MKIRINCVTRGGSRYETEVEAKYVVCGTCQGKNPEFEEACCEECKGDRVVKVVDWDRLDLSIIAAINFLPLETQ